MWDQGPSRAGSAYLQEGPTVDIGQWMNFDAAQFLPADLKYCVAISNVGEYGIISGMGSMTAFSATTEIVVGQRANFQRGASVPIPSLVCEPRLFARPP